MHGFLSVWCSLAIYVTILNSFWSQKTTISLAHSTQPTIEEHSGLVKPANRKRLFFWHWFYFIFLFEKNKMLMEHNASSNHVLLSLFWFLALRMYLCVDGKLYFSTCGSAGYWLYSKMLYWRLVTEDKHFWSLKLWTEWVGSVCLLSLCLCEKGRVWEKLRLMGQMCPGMKL